MNSDNNTRVLQTGFYIWLLDHQGMIITANDAAIHTLGYKTEDLAGKHFSDTAVISGSELTEIIRSVKNNNSVYKSECRIRRKDGTFLDVCLMAENISFGDGTCLLISAIPLFPDLLIPYPKRESSQNLTEIQSYKDNIFSVIAHDLRSPFNTILGYCELLNSSIINSEFNKSVMYTRIIKDATEQTLSFLVRLLDWGRLQNDQPPFNPVYFEAELPVKQVTRLCGFQADTKNILLRVEMEAGLKIYGDINMIRTVLVNLISNSIKFCNPGGKIIIKSYKVSDGVEFDVADNGIGIKKEDLQKLFSREKVQSTSGTCMEHGTGLGLAICKSYVALHHGTLWAESEPGIGSTFKFILPSKNPG